VDFELSDEQAMLREASRDLLADRASVAALRQQMDGAPEVDPVLWRLAAELGWVGLLVPEEHGGSGQGLVELSVVAEELGRSVARGPFLATSVVAHAVGRHGAPDVRAEVLPGLAEGTHWATWAFAEPGLTWTLDGIRTTARMEGDFLVLNGTKTAVQDADGARWLLITAVEEGRPASYLVDRRAPGVQVRRQRSLDLTRTFSEVGLTDVRVPLSRRLAGGTEEIQRLLDDACVLLAAETLGTLDRMLELTVDYVRVRQQFGRPLGSFQAVKQACSTMAMQLLGARAVTYSAAMAADAGTADAGQTACVAAAFTSGIAGDVAGQALQLHGGIGFTWEHDLHLFLRRAKADAVLLGDAPVHRERLSTLIRARRDVA